jgi:Bacterial virulence protein (VirJ)
VVTRRDSSSRTLGSSTDSRPSARLWRRIGMGLTALALVGSAACATLSRIDADPATAPRVFSTTVTLRGQAFDLHLVAPPRPRVPDVLVLYASGDGGWFGAAVDMFRTVGDAGFYAVGVNSRTFLHRKLPSGQPLTVAELAEDYRTIIDRASAALDLPPGRRVVLTGWSRGASLAVLAGSARHAPPNLAGVIAIGLAADENLAVSSDTDDDPAEDKALARDGSSLDMYSLIAQVAPGRSAVIQATGDHYLRAARARELFGADTELRRFYAVTAKNHRFGGGAAAFVAALRSALDWVVGASSIQSQ